MNYFQFLTFKEKIDLTHDFDITPVNLDTCPHDDTTVHDSSLICSFCHMILCDNFDSVVTEYPIFNENDVTYSSKGAITVKKTIGEKKFKNLMQYNEKFYLDKDGKYKEKESHESSLKEKEHDLSLDFLKKLDSMKDKDHKVIRDFDLFELLKKDEKQGSVFKIPTKNSSFEVVFEIIDQVFIRSSKNRIILEEGFYYVDDKKIYSCCENSLKKKKDLSVTKCEFKKIYDIYTHFLQHESSALFSKQEKKKRNKPKPYIEAFCIMLLFHFMNYHEHDDEVFIIENCLGLIINTKGHLTYKKKNIKSFLFSLMKILGMNEITSQNHILDCLKILKLKIQNP